jgi:hypothetical protein
MPVPPKDVDSDRLDVNRLRITWDSGQPVYPNTDTPFATTFRYLPGFIIKDDGLSDKDKMMYSPFYILQKESFPNEILKFDNSDHNTISDQTYSYSSGISESEMNSRTNTFSVSVTGGTGDASPAKFEMTYSFSHAWTNEKTTGKSSETTRSSTIHIKPGEAMALYAVKYKFTVKRLNGTIISSWEVNGSNEIKPISSKNPTK